MKIHILVLMGALPKAALAGGVADSARPAYLQAVVGLLHSLKPSQAVVFGDYLSSETPDPVHLRARLNLTQTAPYNDFVEGRLKASVVAATDALDRRFASPTDSDLTNLAVRLRAVAEISPQIDEKIREGLMAPLTEAARLTNEERARRVQAAMDGVRAALTEDSAAGSREPANPFVSQDPPAFLPSGGLSLSASSTRFNGTLNGAPVDVRMERLAHRSDLGPERQEITFNGRPAAPEEIETLRKALARYLVPADFVFPVNARYKAVLESLHEAAGGGDSYAFFLPGSIQKGSPNYPDAVFFHGYLFDAQAGVYRSENLVYDGKKDSRVFGRVIRGGKVISREEQASLAGAIETYLRHQLQPYDGQADEKRRAEYAALVVALRK